MSLQPAFIRPTPDFTMKRVKEEWSADWKTCFYLNLSTGSVFFQATKTGEILDLENLRLLWIGPEPGVARPKNYKELCSKLLERIDFLRERGVINVDSGFRFT